MLRQETQDDYKIVDELVKDVFANSSTADLVVDDGFMSNLRSSGSFIPELCLVVQEGWDIVGSISCFKINDVVEIKQISVMPILQGSAVGLQLIMETKEIAKKLGFSKIIVKSNLDCFKRYGFKQQDDYLELCL